MNTFFKGATVHQAMFLLTVLILGIPVVTIMSNVYGHIFMGIMTLIGIVTTLLAIVKFLD